MEKVENAVSEKKRRFRKPENLAIKILSVVAALAIWFYVMSVEAPNFEDDFNGVTVDLYGVTELEDTYGISAIFGREQSVDVTLSGKKNIVNGLKPEDVYAYVDVSSITNPGRYTLDVHINAPAGITVKNFHPASVSVYLDKQISKLVTVKTQKSSVSLPSELSLGTVTTDVEYVTVTGPAEFVDTVSAAQLNLDLKNIAASTTYTDKVVLVDKDGKEISNTFTKTNPSSVTATVPIIVTKDVKLGVDFVHGYFNGDNSTVTVSPASIKLSMPVELSSSIDEITVATIDETHIAGNTSLQSAIKLPSGVTGAMENMTATVNISLKNLETASFTVDKKNITAENVPEGYTVEIVTKSVTFGARGPVGTVSSMESSDFKAVIDLSGHSVAGNSSVPLTIRSSKASVYVLNAEESYPAPTVMVKLDKVK